METGKNQISIEELFRQKLENAEMIPGERVSDDLMRKLSRLEFLRFNPSRFNIYYLGLIAAGVITAGLLLLSHPKAEDDAPQPQPGQEQTSEVVPVSENTPVNRSRSETRLSSNENKPAKVTASQQEKAGNVIKVTEREQEVVSPAGVSSSFSKNIVIKDQNQPLLQARSSGNPALFVPSAVSGCAPLKVRFSNLAGNYTSYRWAFGDGGFSDQKDPEWIFDVEGDYKVMLTASDENGRTANWSVPVRVYPHPKAQFEISPEKAVLPIDDIRFINYSAGAAGYKWEFGDGASSNDPEPVHKYLKYGRYDVSLIAISENGCSDTLVVKNAFSGSEYYINMPNAFIPNSQGPSGGLYSVKTDETAEIFHPSHSGVIDYQLRIFAKTGALLFESNDLNTGWDGYYKGQLCNPGVYIWKVRGNFSNGEPFTKMGDVTLLKD